MKTILLLSSLLGIISLNKVQAVKERPLYITPPNILHHFSLGYNDFLANILWVRFLQNADFCSFEKGLPVYKGTVQHCKDSWAFHMINAITELAPRFRTAYLTAPPIISIFIGDKKGAEKTILKGLKAFPNDWRLNFFAVYHYSKEDFQPELASKYAHAAAENGGPSWLYSLSLKQNQNDQHLIAETLIKNALKRDLSAKQRKYFEEELKRISEEKAAGERILTSKNPTSPPEDPEKKD